MTPHLLAVVLAASAWDAPRTLVFGEARRWVLFHAKDSSVEPWSPPGDLDVQGAAATSDGKTLFLIARPKDALKWSLYRWRPKAEERPTELLPTKGYYSFVTVSPDDKWVYFSHHPEGGPLGRHASGAFAQVHRVHPDGSGLEKLTSSDGCKLGACPLRKGGVLMLHSNCSGSAEIQTLDAKGTEATLGGRFAQFNDMTVAPDGESALLMMSTVTGPRVLEWTKKTGALRLVADGFVTAAHAQYGRSRSEVLAWNDGLVRVVDGKLQPVVVDATAKVGGSR